MGNLIIPTLALLAMACAQDHVPPAPDGEQPYDDEPIIVITIVDPGPVEDESDAGTQQSDAAPTIVDASTPDAAQVHADGGAQDASIQPDVSPEPATYIHRVCRTSDDCRDPFLFFESPVYTWISLPRDGYEPAGEEPICLIKAGATTGRCSFFCSLNGAWFADQHRWCNSFNSQCLPLDGSLLAKTASDTGSACGRPELL